MNNIYKYIKFNINIKKKKKIKKFYKIYKKFIINKINLISFNSYKKFYINHILDSLSLINIIKFKYNTKILDYGTGGGFPGIPLAIIFPNVKFTLVDSIKKKINILKFIIKKINIKNIKLINIKCEKLKLKFDFIISRYIKNIYIIYKNMNKYINKISKNKLSNGFFFYYCKKKYKKYLINIKNYKIFNINKYIKLSFFKKKKIIYIY
ncbi:MAG: 16S rRNA (guanine(527)-N(7))-methyltransferase RsmG [Candidatus Shikimatogenerans sp. Tcar]|uniref:Ribosomal RNA small subunit methyltransferase G n=1 Tax=Candidatus Shikimatogenerans sp. Tcar TaxID=3158565 RepID=A0AAU7QTS5_9FLAO